MKLVDILKGQSVGQTYHHGMKDGHVMIRFPRWDAPGTILVEAYTLDGKFKGDILAKFIRARTSKDGKQVMVLLKDYDKVHAITTVDTSGGAPEKQSPGGGTPDGAKSKSSFMPRAKRVTKIEYTRHIDVNLPSNGWTSTEKPADVAGLRRKRRVNR